jgi:uncharacterized protein
MTVSVTTPVPLSRWRPTPARLAVLLAGLVLFGAGEACIVGAGAGASPWTVFAQGVSVQTPLTIGAATVATSFALILLWVPLRQRPGLGTVLNAIVVGATIDVVLLALPADPGPAVQVLQVAGGIALVGLGSGLYLRTALGPGPRDGLMTGLHRVTGRPVALVRAAIELSALAAGVALGGTFGPGTVAFALLVGPAVALGLRVAGVRHADRL